jgi:hypothetical protein
LQAEPVEAPPHPAAAPTSWLPVAVVGLTIAAVSVRLRALPRDGLLFDDAWVAFGASGGSPGELFAVSTLHPGFSALLMAWARLVPDTTTWMAVPALLAGACLPAVVVWASARLAVRPAIALGAGTLAVLAPTHVVYSGRVKPYTLETIAIVVLAVALGPLSRRRWQPSDAALWVVAAVVVGSVNAFALVAVGVAGLVLVLHPNRDRGVRAAAVGAQALVQLGLLAWMRASFDHRGLESAWGDTFDGYVELSADLPRSVGEVATHLTRVGLVVVDLWWPALLLVLVAGAGLVVEARRGREPVVARFLLALPLVGFLGSVFELLPFGTRDQTRLFPGTRASLWLLPSVLLGVALAAERAFELARRRGPSAERALAAASGVALVVVALGALGRDVTYPAPGTDTVSAVVADRGPADLVLVMETARWSLAAAEERSFELVPDHVSMVGYVPALDDPGLEMVSPGSPWAGSAAQLRVAGGSSPGVPWDCVYIVEGAVGVFDGIRAELQPSMVVAGYEQRDVVHAGESSVDVWGRAGGPAC